jgi:hypothetical protein
MEVMNYCVIIHNMIIESERTSPPYDDHPYECEDPLTVVNHELPADFADFFAMDAEIHDADAHTHNLVEHLWMIKGSSAAPAA